MKESTLKKLHLFPPRSSAVSGGPGLTLPLSQTWYFGKQKTTTRKKIIEATQWSEVPCFSISRVKEKAHPTPRLITTARDTRDWDLTLLGCTKRTRNSLKVHLLSQRRWGLCARLCPICEPQALVHLCSPAQLPAERSASATLLFGYRKYEFWDATHMQCLPQQDPDLV